MPERVVDEVLEVRAVLTLDDEEVLNQTYSLIEEVEGDLRTDIDRAREDWLKRKDEEAEEENDGV